MVFLLSLFTQPFVWAVILGLVAFVLIRNEKRNQIIYWPNERGGYVHVPLWHWMAQIVTIEVLVMIFLTVVLAVVPAMSFAFAMALVIGVGLAWFNHVVKTIELTNGTYTHKIRLWRLTALLVLAYSIFLALVWSVALGIVIFTIYAVQHMYYFLKWHNSLARENHAHQKHGVDLANRHRLPRTYR